MINSLYLCHDKDYNYRVVVSAIDANEAIEKLKKYIKETKQFGEMWYEPEWIADLSDCSHG